MCSFHNFMCLLEPKHKHTVTCHGSNKQWGNSNGKNDSVEKEAKAKKKKHTQHQQQAMRACVAIWSGRQKKNQSRCCLALCKIPNSTGLSTVDAKCQLYHKTKAVGKVHKQFCHSPFTLKCTYIYTYTDRMHEDIYISRYEFTNLKAEIRQYFEIPQHSNAHHLLVTQ